MKEGRGRREEELERQREEWMGGKRGGERVEGSKEVKYGWGVSKGGR